MDRTRRLFKPAVAAFVAALVLGTGIARADEARLDALFDQLSHAESADITRRIESEITREMMRTGSPALDLLLRRGGDALEARNYQAAIDHLTALIDHAPDVPQAWNMRAVAYYMIGNTGPALWDLGQALLLEPRHYRALQGVAIMLEELGEPEDALMVWRAALAIAPGDVDISAAIRRLERELDGTPI